MAPTWADINRAKSLTGTAYTDPILNDLADDAEDDIKAELEVNLLDTNPTPVPELLKIVAKNWLCRNIRRKQKHDGTAPNSYNSGSQGISVTIDQTISDYDQKGRLALDQYIADQSDDEDSEDCLVQIAEDS